MIKSVCTYGKPLIGHPSRKPKAQYIKPCKCASSFAWEKVNLLSTTPHISIDFVIVITIAIVLGIVVTAVVSVIFIVMLISAIPCCWQVLYDSRMSICPAYQTELLRVRSESPKVIRKMECLWDLNLFMLLAFGFNWILPYQRYW